MNNMSSQLRIVDESTQPPEQPDAPSKGNTLISNVLIMMLLIATMIAGYGVYFQDISRLDAASEAPLSSSNRRSLLGFIDQRVGLPHPERSHPNLRYELDNLTSKRHNNRVILTDVSEATDKSSSLKEKAAKLEVFGEDEDIKWELSR